MMPRVRNHVDRSVRRIPIHRVHRSTIVNVSKIKELLPCDSGEYIAVLRNGQELSCSRGCRAQLQRLIENKSLTV
jgi:DNA-binding LytR/AlgR family response regulator